jgi:TetR/AcrR family transcriptional regulator, cholesterol catabolism regulator
MPAEIRRKMFKGYKFLVDTFEKIIQAGIKSGDFREVNANLVAQDLILAMQAWAYRRWLLRNNFTLEKYISEQIEIMRKLLTKEQQH